MRTSCHIRACEPGDERGILDLRDRVFEDLDPVRRRLHAWRWQFQNNPAGPGFGMVAEDQGRIVGQYAAIANRFSVCGKETLLAMSCDTMIDPQYRRQGLFVRLAQRLYHELEARHDIHVVWGFPNRQSLPGFANRLGWRVMRPLPLMIKPLRPLSMLCRVFKPLRHLSRVPGSVKPVLNKHFLKQYPSVSISPVTHFDAAFDTLWQEHAPADQIIQIRDSRYLNWRYLGIPDFEYRPFAIWRDDRLMGYMVLRVMGVKGHYFGVLMDLFPFPRNALLLRAILSVAGNTVKARGGDFLTCLLPWESYHILKYNGFIRVPESINPKTWYWGYRCRTGKLPAGWHITGGDTDVV